MICVITGANLNPHLTGIFFFPRKQTVDLSPFTTVEAAFEAVIEAFDIVQPDKHALYANGVAMEDHKTLLAYRLRSGDTIEIGFKRDVSELKVVLSGTGSGGGADRVVRLRFDQDTLVGTAVDMIRSAAGLGDEGSGLYFVEECLWLDAGERLSSYDLLSEEVRRGPVVCARACMNECPKRGVWMFAIAFARL